jgi:UDP-N-acetylmuramate--alanine ligase
MPHRTGKVDPILIPDVADIAADLPSMLRPGDLVLLLGAGNIGHVAEQIRENGFPRKEAA